MFRGFDGHTVNADDASGARAVLRTLVGFVVKGSSGGGSTYKIPTEKIAASPNFLDGDSCSLNSIVRGNITNAMSATVEVTFVATSAPVLLTPQCPVPGWTIWSQK